MVKIYPRYEELLEKRGKFISDDELPKVVAKFSEQDFLDLQVWFNLAWFGYLPKTGDLLLKELIKKGRNFTEEIKKNCLISKLKS